MRHISHTRAFYFRRGSVLDTCHIAALKRVLQCARPWWRHQVV